MKTKTVRVPGVNHTTPRAKNQPQTPAPSPLVTGTVQECPLPVGEDVHPACLCLFDRSTQKPVCKIPLNEDEFCNLLTMAAGPDFRGLYTAGIIAGVIRTWFNDGYYGAFCSHIEKVDEFALPTACPSAQCLVIFDRVDQKPVSKVPLTEDEFNYLLNAPAVLPDFHDMPPAAIIASALRDFLFKTALPATRRPAAPDASQVFPGVSTMEFESAKIETCALITLLCSKLNDIHETGYNFEGPQTDEILAGFQMMAHHAKSGLRLAFDNLHSAIQQARRQPAPVAAAA